MQLTNGRKNQGPAPFAATGPCVSLLGSTVIRTRGGCLTDSPPTGVKRNHLGG